MPAVNKIRHNEKKGGETKCDDGAQSTQLLSPPVPVFALEPVLPALPLAMCSALSSAPDEAPPPISVISFDNGRGYSGIGRGRRGRCRKGFERGRRGRRNGKKRESSRRGGTAIHINQIV